MFTDYPHLFEYGVNWIAFEGSSENCYPNALPKTLYNTSHLPGSFLRLHGARVKKCEFKF
jgi:hypothetical protein